MQNLEWFQIILSMKAILDIKGRQSMRKIVINTSMGGFTISRKAYERYLELGGKSIVEADTTLDDFSKEYGINPHVNRDNPLLIQVIEELGNEASTNSKLCIVEIPNDIIWYIYYREDGTEVVCECSRFWDFDGEHFDYEQHR